MNGYIDQLLFLYIRELNSVQFKSFNLLRVVKQMQIQSLWLDIQSSNFHIMQGSFLKFIASLFRMARFSSTDYKYLWIFVFLINIVLLGFYPMSIILEKYFRRQFQYFQSHKSLFNLINLVMSSYQFVLLIPFISISMNVIQNHLTGQDSLIIVFNIINVLFIIIIITIIHSVLGPALEVLKQDSILLYKVKIDYLEFPIQLLLVTLTLGNSQIVQILSTTVTSLYFLSKLYTLTFHFQQNTSHLLEISIVCFNLYTIFSILFVSPHESSIILLNFPITYYIIILVRDRQIQQCCIGLSRNVKKTQFRQIYLLKNQNIICNTIKINFIIKHQLQCQDLNCLCKQKIQDKSIILMNQEFYQSIMDQRKNKLLYFQHYVSFLINLDQSPKAINFLRKFIFDDQLKQKSINSEAVGKLDRIKFQILLQKSLQILSQETDSSATKEQLSISIQQFLNQEEESNKIINCVEQSIYLKYNFLTQMINEQNFEMTFNRGQMVIGKIIQNIEYLQQEYQQFQSIKLQSALSFLYAEVICNNFRAYQINQFGLQNNLKFVFSNDINYLKIYVNDQLNMFIKFRSNQCYQLFGYQQEEFLRILDAQVLLPTNFIKIHKKLLYRYFETGKSKFYKESNVNLITDKEGFLKQIDFFFDIQQTMNFIIVCFFKELKQTNGIILVNNELKICGINRYFLSQIGIYTLDRQNEYQKYLYDQPINDIIPDFDSLNNEQQSAYVKTHNYDSNSSNNSKNQRKYQNQIKMRISIEKFCVEEYSYFIIYLDSIFTEQNTIFTNLDYNTQLQIEDIPQESPALYPQLVDNYQFDNIDNIISPKNSVMGFIKSQYNDQIFFTSQIKSNTVFSDNIQNENRKQSQRFEFLKPSQNFRKMDDRDNDQNNEQNEINSQISSVAGFKRSKYYKLYDLFNRLTTGKKKQNHFQITLLLYLIILVLCLAYCVIILNNSITDLNRFVNEIDMLSIKSQFYGPLINYQVALLSVGNYYRYLVGGLMNLTQIVPLWSYDYYVMNQSYQILKQSYIDINSNSQIMKFVQEQSLDVHMQVALNQIEDRHLSLDQVINQLYFNAHLFSQQDISKYIVNGTNWPEVTFYMANMIEFLNKISNMIEEIRQYSLNRADIIYEKWYIYQILFTISVFILLVSCAYKFYTFTNQLKFFTSIVALQDIKSINSEVKRLKFIYDYIKSDPQQIFNYQFNMELKDEQLQSRQSENQVNYERSYREGSLKSDRLPIIFYIITNLVLLGIFLSYCIIINVQVNTYLTIYKPSVEFYIKICNQSTSASGSFAAREIIYFSNRGSYYFLKPDNINEWKNVFIEQLSQTNSFRDSSDYIDQNNILATSDFISEFNKIKQGNICQLLSVEELITAQYHCKQDFNGVLERGLLITTNTINNLLMNEYQINNFQNRTIPSIQEIEVGLIIYSALRNLIDQFKNNLSDVTKSLQNQILIITSFYICFIFIKFMILFSIFSKYYNLQYYRARNMIFLKEDQDNICCQMIYYDYTNKFNHPNLFSFSISEIKNFQLNK
ncbi:hypothetical protein pb186bvf_002245 [Paramecium bursaria]